MTNNTRSGDFGPIRGLYRDRENGWIFGVCAGLADRFGLNVGPLRLIAVVALLLAFWMSAAIYAAMVLLIPEKPLLYSGRMSESEFWRRYRNDEWRSS